MSSGDDSPPDAAPVDQVDTSMTVQLVDEEQWHAVVSRLQFGFGVENFKKKIPVNPPRNYKCCATCWP